MGVESDLLSSWAVEDDLAVLKINFEGLQIPVVDAKHGPFEIKLKDALQLSYAVHLTWQVPSRNMHWVLMNSCKLSSKLDIQQVCLQDQQDYAACIIANPARPQGHLSMRNHELTAWQIGSSRHS